MTLCPSCGGGLPEGGWSCLACGYEPLFEHGHAVLAPELAAGDGADAEYRHDALAAAEPAHFWFRSRRRLILWALGRFCGGSARFLEIGCGTGYVLQGIREAFPGMELFGSDALVAGLAFARRRVPHATLFQMDARRIPFVDHFDAIGAFDVIEHVEEDETVLLAMRRALRPGGSLLLTVPQHPRLWSEVDDFSHHKRRYTRRELVAKTKAAGLEVVHASSFFTVTLPVLLASRLARPRSDAFDPEAELRVPRLLNVALGAVTGLERALIRCGVALPVGGSLLVVARRPAA
jgi:SAM-dependent methyltransferase